MATSLLALLDDITLLADDVAAMSKVAAKKTAGVLGDDIALNANQMTGFSASRELPVVWAVAKGSALNKAILVPVALLLLAFAPWALTPLLMIGGAFLCYEGAEKVFHKLLHSQAEDEKHHARLKQTLAQTPEQLCAAEREKIKGAVRTDFILSAEIVAIALGTLQGASFLTQAVALATVAIFFTVGVYALVAGVVKLDDLGIYLASAGSAARRAIGRFVLAATPYFMKTLSIVGTVAMFLVGGGIITHRLAPLEHAISGLEQQAHAVAGIGPALAVLTPLLLNLAAGLLIGALVLGLVKLVSRLFGKRAAAH